MTVVNPYRFAAGGGGGSLLLDVVTGATAAYSLRLLRTGYTGSAIRVRRSSDNAEQDIGFSSGDLDTSALSTFVGANSGFVVTWYDQSGNGYDAAQSTTGRQPRIVNAGTIETDAGSDTTLNFLGGQVLKADFNPATLTQPTWLTYLIQRTTVSASTMYVFDSFDGADRQAAFNTNTSTESVFAGSTKSTSFTPDTSRHIFSLLFDDASSAQWVDGVDYSSATSPGTDGLDGLSIGARFGNTSYLEGYVTEFVVWPADKSSSRATIESHIATHYGITL